MMKQLTRTLFLALMAIACAGLSSCEFFSDNPVSPQLKVRTSSMTVEVGSSQKCNVSASTRAKLLYASNDESIATVDEKGIVTGVSVGDAVITVVATNQDGSELFLDESAVIAVKVVANENVVKATDLLKEAQKEGANVVFWYHYEGELFYAVFKKVGDEYVYQEGGNCNKASTRCSVVYTQLTPELLELKGDEADLGFNVYSADDAGNKNDPIILCKVFSSTAEVKQKTNCPNNYLAAMAANIQNVGMKTIMDDVKDIFNGDNKGYQPDNKNLENVSLLTADDNTDQLLFKSLPEIEKNAAEQGISPEKAIGAPIDNLQQKMAEDYNDGSSKIPTVNFEMKNPIVTWSPKASENSPATTPESLPPLIPSTTPFRCDFSK